MPKPTDLITREQAALIIEQCAEDIRDANVCCAEWGGCLKGPKTKAGAVKRAADVLRGKLDSYYDSYNE